MKKGRKTAGVGAGGWAPECEGGQGGEGWGGGGEKVGWGDEGWGANFYAFFPFPTLFLFFLEDVRFYPY